MFADIETRMLNKKKPWVAPRVRPVQLSEAREKVLSALNLIEDDESLADLCAELRSLIAAIDTDLGSDDTN